MNFGKRIKDFRSKKNISQEELAKMIDVHTNHLSRYERNLTSPSIEVVKKMAEALEVSIDLLVFGKQNIENAIQDKELIDLFKRTEQFNNSNKQTIKDLISAFVLKQELAQKLAQ